MLKRDQRDGGHVWKTTRPPCVSIRCNDTSATASADHAEMVRISRAGFMNCLKGNTDLAMLIMQHLVKRLREADRMIESLALIDVHGRVARLLIEPRCSALAPHPVCAR